MEEISRGYFRMLQQTPWLREYVILLEVVCTSRDPLEEDSILDCLDLLGLNESIASMWCKGWVSELDFHALARCSHAAFFSFAPGGSLTAALEYFVCQPRGNKRPIASLSNPILYQVPGLIPYRRGDYDSIAIAIHYTLDLPGGQWTGVPGTPRLEDCNTDIFYTAEQWTKYVLSGLMENLLRGCKPAGTSDTCVRSSRSPQAFAEAWDADEELRSGDGTRPAGDGGGDSTGSYNDENDTEGEKDGEKDREEDGGEEDTERESSEDGTATPVERIRARSVEVEGMHVGSPRER